MCIRDREKAGKERGEFGNGDGKERGSDQEKSRALMEKILPMFWFVLPFDKSEQPCFLYEHDGYAEERMGSGDDVSFGVLEP
eukprot:5894521-Prorocentrum_lima.AAC.1